MILQKYITNAQIKQSFLVNDTTLPSNNPLLFSLNLLKRIYTKS